MNKNTGILLFILGLSVAWAGSIWTLNNTPSSEVFNGVSSPNGYFAIAVGENGSIVHFNNGDTGTVMPSGTTQELYDVYASSEHFAVAAGEDVVLLWDGNQWSELFSSNSNTIYTGTWISPEEDVVLYESLGQFNVICPYHPGAQNQPFCRAYTYPMITACGESNDIKMVMSSGNIEHVNNFLGDLTDNAPLHTEPVPLFLTGVWAPPLACAPGSIEPFELFAIRGGDELWYFDGSDWANMNVTIPADQTLTWLSGTSSSNIVATGFKPDGMGGNAGVIWLYDGQNWTEDTSVPDGTPGLTDVVANINRTDLIYADGFDGLMRSMRGGQGAKVDILAAAENGQFIYSSDLFPGSISDLSISKRLLDSEPIRQGQRITFQLVIQNLGPDTADMVRLVDGYGNQLTLAVDDCGMSEFNFQGGWHYREKFFTSIAPGDVIFCTMEFDVTGPVGDRIYNYASVISLKDNNYRNNRSDVNDVIIQTP